MSERSFKRKVFVTKTLLVQGLFTSGSNVTCIRHEIQSSSLIENQYPYRSLICQKDRLSSIRNFHCESDTFQISSTVTHFKLPTQSFLHACKKQIKIAAVKPSSSAEWLLVQCVKTFKTTQVLQICVVKLDVKTTFKSFGLWCFSAWLMATNYRNVNISCLRHLRCTLIIPDGKFSFMIQ